MPAERRRGSASETNLYARKRRKRGKNRQFYCGFFRQLTSQQPCSTDSPMRRDTITLLVCEDDVLYQRSLSLLLKGDFALVFTRDSNALLAATSQYMPDVVLLDICLQTEHEGFAVLAQLKARWPDLPVVMHSGQADYTSVVRAMRLGATDYIPKDSDSDKVSAHLRQIIAQRRRAREMRTQTITQTMIGSHPRVVELNKMIQRVKDYPGNVIITGESGVGKELVAASLKRDNAPFVAIDAATIAVTTAESMLFGHVRGAFTGADKAHRGRLEAADGGILYFDEIANMSLDVQAKLLRALQEKEVVPLGGDIPRRLNFRVVCATNRDLEQLCSDGRFRHDLYTRLNVFTLRVPPLRERASDIVALVEYFVALYSPHHHVEIDPRVMVELCAYDWPGNIRELGNTVQYILAMRDVGGPIQLRHLPAKMNHEARQFVSTEEDARGFHQRMLAFERQLLAREYLLARGNISRMARTLKMDRSNLTGKLTEHAIHSSRKVVSPN